MHEPDGIDRGVSGIEQAIQVCELRGYPATSEVAQRELNVLLATIAELRRERDDAIAAAGSTDLAVAVEALRAYADPRNWRTIRDSQSTLLAGWRGPGAESSVPAPTHLAVVALDELRVTT